MKTCTKCRKTRDDADFYVLHHGTLKTWCIECTNRERAESIKAQRARGISEEKRARQNLSVRVRRAVKLGELARPTACPRCGRPDGAHVMRAVNVHMKEIRTKDVHGRATTKKKIDQVEWLCFKCHMGDLRAPDPPPSPCLVCGEPAPLIGRGQRGMTCGDKACIDIRRSGTAWFAGDSKGARTAKESLARERARRGMHKPRFGRRTDR